MISIIMPVYNQYKSLDIVLWHFCKQTTSKPFEIILVDDCSTDFNVNILDKYNSLPIKYYRNQKNMGRSYTRNVAIDNSSGDFLIFCDCDRLPTPNYIESHIKAIDSDNPIISIGYTTETYEKNYSKLKIDPSKILRRKALYYKVISQIYDNVGQTDSSLCWLSTLSGNMALKRSTLNNHRFDCEFSNWGFEHFELGYRLHKDGVVFRNNMYAENIHLAHKRISGFYINCIEQSYDVFYKKHPEDDVLYLKQFVMGEISLQDYEKKTNPTAHWYDNHKKPLVINVVNI